MNAKTFLIAFAIVLALFGGGLYYTINYAYYDVVEAETMALTSTNGDTIEMLDVSTLDAPTSPLKMRRCGMLQADGEKLDAIFERAEEATPLVAPKWFDCFNAEKLSVDIESGMLTPYIYRSNEPWGIDTILLFDPKTKAGYMWHQFNKCSNAHYEDQPLPDDCPPFEE